MARKSTQAAREIEPDPEDELNLEPEEEPLAEVTQRTLTTKRYFEAAPGSAPQLVQEEPEKDWLEAFLQENAGNRNLDLIVHHLPYYEQNGNTSTTAPGRTWVTKIKFNAESKNTFRDTVQAFFPAGGWFHFDLRDNGEPVKNGRFVEKIAPLPQSVPAQAAGAQGYPVVINPQQPAPPVDPFAAVKPMMGFMKDMVGFAQGLIPAPAPAPPATNGEARPIGEQLVGAALVKMVESDKVSPDQLMGMIGATREPGWLESPVITEVAGKALGPGGSITVVLEAFADRIRVQTRQSWLETQIKAKQAGVDPGAAASGAAASAASGGVGASSAPAQIPGTGAAEGEPASPPLTDEQRMERAYRRTASRIVEDCMEGGSINSSCESIIDLIERYENLRPPVDALLLMEPVQVFEWFAQMAGDQNTAVMVFNLSKSQLNLDWIKNLQARAAEMIKEWEESQKEDAE